MNIGEKIRQARKEKGISQEALAEQLGLSVQAVSKWECDLSCPDIALLPRIADYLEVTLDHLLREEQSETRTETAVLAELPDDNTLRILQCIGRRIVSRNEWNSLDQKKKIPLYFDKAWENHDRDLEVKLEIWGAADIAGSIAGDVTAGGTVNCDNIGNNVNAGGSVNCDNVGNNANAGCSIYCDNVGNDANAGAGVTCNNVGNNVSAGNSVTCGDVQGDVRCDGEIHCGNIAGNVTGGEIFVDGK